MNIVSLASPQAGLISLLKITATNETETTTTSTTSTSTSAAAAAASKRAVSVSPLTITAIVGFSVLFACSILTFIWILVRKIHLRRQQARRDAAAAAAAATAMINKRKSISGGAPMTNQHQQQQQQQQQQQTPRSSSVSSVGSTGSGGGGGRRRARKDKAAPLFGFVELIIISVALFAAFRSANYAIAAALPTSPASFVLTIIGNCPFFSIFIFLITTWIQVCRHSLNSTSNDNKKMWAFIIVSNAIVYLVVGALGFAFIFMKMMPAKARTDLILTYIILVTIFQSVFSLIILALGVRIVFLIVNSYRNVSLTSTKKKNSIHLKVIIKMSSLVIALVVLFNLRLVGLFVSMFVPGHQILYFILFTVLSEMAPCFLCLAFFGLGQADAGKKDKNAAGKNAGGGGGGSGGGGGGVPASPRTISSSRAGKSRAELLKEYQPNQDGTITTTTTTTAAAAAAAVALTEGMTFAPGGSNANANTNTNNVTTTTTTNSGAAGPPCIDIEMQIMHQRLQQAKASINKEKILASSLQSTQQGKDDQGKDEEEEEEGEQQNPPPPVSRYTIIEDIEALEQLHTQQTQPLQQHPELQV